MFPFLKASTQQPHADLHVLDSRPVYEDGHLDHIWYEVETPDGDGERKRGFKVIVLYELWALPAATKENH